jgi:hypothetical protein
MRSDPARLQTPLDLLEADATRARVGLQAGERRRSLSCLCRSKASRKKSTPSRLRERVTSVGFTWGTRPHLIRCDVEALRGSSPLRHHAQRRSARGQRDAPKRDADWTASLRSQRRRHPSSAPIGIGSRSRPLLTRADRDARGAGAATPARSRRGARSVRRRPGRAPRRPP